jgi:hypothetical protein
MINKLVKLQCMPRPDAVQAPAKQKHSHASANKAITLTRLCSQSSSGKRAILEPWPEEDEAPRVADGGDVRIVMRPLSSSPTKKLAAQSTSTAFPDIGLARAAFFSDCGCVSA